MAARLSELLHDGVCAQWWPTCLAIALALLRIRRGTRSTKKRSSLDDRDTRLNPWPPKLVLRARFTERNSSLVESVERHVRGPHALPNSSIVLPI